jgi:hypothetical protein
MTAVACSAADPGIEKLTRGQGTIGDSGINPNFDSGGPKPDGSSGMDSGGMMMDSGAVNAFTGAGAYMSGQPATSAKQQHTTNMVGVTPDKTQACLTCHKNGGAGVEFMFAGSIFTDQAGTMPAANYEVRVRGSDGVAYIAHSDADGNFWFKKGMANLQFPANSGGRNMSATALMMGTITTGDCNDGGCHAGNQGAIHVP